MPLEVRLAAWRFRGERARYYEYLAVKLGAAQGAVKFLPEWQLDAQRRAGTARGTLCAWWADRYQETPSVSHAIDGTLPADDVMVLRIAEATGGDAIESALRDLARIAGLSDRIRQSVWTTLGVGFVGCLMGIVSWSVYPVRAVSEFKRMFNMPVEAFGPQGRALAAHAQWCESYWPLVLFGLVALGVLMSWAWGNFVGPARDWLDRHVGVFRTSRDIQSARFVALIAMLTKRRSGRVITLGGALQALANHSATRWQRWRVGELLERAQMPGTEPFHTPLLSDEVYWYLTDMEPQYGLDGGLNKTSLFVEEVILKDIQIRLAFWRWVLMLTGVILTASMYIWVMAIYTEMPDASVVYQLSR